MSIASGIDLKKVVPEALITLLIEFFLFLFLNMIVGVLPFLSYYMLYVVMTGTIILFALVCYLWVTKKVSNLGGLVCLLLVIASHVYFLNSQPWCKSESVLFQVMTQDTKSALQMSEESNRVLANPSKLLIIEALPTSGFSKGEINTYQCDWLAKGDGSIESSKSCSILYKAGRDQIDDAISVKLSQPGCDRVVLGSLFTSSLE